MKTLLVIGAGGHGKVVAEVAVAVGYKKIAFLDDNASEAIGKLSDIKEWTEYKEGFCGIGNNYVRKKIIAKLIEAGYKIPVLIHPTAYVSESATIGAGTIVEPKAIINTNSVIGCGSIVSIGAIVDHDVKVGEYAHINAGSIVKAGGKIENFEKLEAGEVKLGYKSAIVKKTDT